MGDKPKFYITTAIAYTSRKPHIGNSYEIVLTDAIARYKRMQGYDVFFLTGTDEHGQKIEEYAKAAGVTPKAYVDKVAGEIRAICDALHTTYDKFIRTTDDYHEKAVQKIFKSSMIRAISIKANTRGSTAPRARAFGRKASWMKTAAAPTATDLLKRRRRKRISCGFRNTRSSLRILLKAMRISSTPKRVKRKCSTTS